MGMDMTPQVKIFEKVNDTIKLEELNDFMRNTTVLNIQTEVGKDKFGEITTVMVVVIYTDDKMPVNNVPNMGAQEIEVIEQ